LFAKLEMGISKALTENILLQNMFHIHIADFLNILLEQ
jgi:hypothetical protein